MRPIFQEFQDDREAAMKKMGELRKRTLTKIEGKLNDEQKKTWKELPVPRSRSSSRRTDRASRPGLRHPARFRVWQEIELNIQNSRFKDSKPWRHGRYTILEF